MAVRNKHLKHILPKHSGRDHQGHVSVRHRGGRQKRFYREIDFDRRKLHIKAKVVEIESDPNRNSDIALVQYTDGEKRYILAPLGLKPGDIVESGETVEIKVGNALPLKKIPVGTGIHNIETSPGKGGKLVRSAGAMATVLAEEGRFVHVKFPSGEVKRFLGDCFASIGQIGNIDWRTKSLGTAGRARRLGKRPNVRGTAQHPGSHPHGGGEGRSGIGMKSPKSPWGKRTLGKKTRRPKKYSDKYVVKDRREK